MTPFSAAFPARALAAVLALIGVCAAMGAETPQRGESPGTEKIKILRTTFECELSRLVLNVYGADSGEALRYQPNNPCEFKIGAQYGKIGAKLGIFSTGADDDLAVRTTCFDFHGFYYYDRFGADLYAQWYRGFQLDGEDVARPDFELTTLTASGYLKIAGTCGLDALTTPIVEGGPIDMLAYAFLSVSRRAIDSGGDIVPQFRATDFPELGGAGKFAAVIPSLSAGTLLSFHWGKIYCTPGVSVGFGYPVVETPRDVRVSNSVKINLKARAGYEGRKWIGGIEVSNDADAIELKGSDAVQFNSVVVNLFVGRKFEIIKKKN